MQIHFIAIGGSAMHNMAIALHNKGFKVTGSDDEIFEPSKTKLAKLGLLPEKIGWNVSHIHKKLDAVILGMHARADNPELIKAKKLGIRIFSYPEYIYEQSKNKKRVVIGGSHGKTTITSMILHVLNYMNMDFDYLVGAQLDGFDTMVKLTESAPVIIIEGDEYLSSPIDRRPKFHLYHPHIALISGIAWDHINVFPTYKEYVEQFRQFITMIEPGGKLIYCGDDGEVNKLVESLFFDKARSKAAYFLPAHFIKNETTHINTGNNGWNPGLKIFGRHNLLNLSGAKLICAELGIGENQFYEAISSFKGASKRLELICKNEHTSIYKDFAHSPSKVKATIEALKEQNEQRKLVACIELHTFSSLNENFLNEYKNTMNNADVAIIYYNPHTIEHKKLKPITEQQVRKSFGKNDLNIFTDSLKLLRYLQTVQLKASNLLMMSSGNFDGLNLDDIIKR